MDRNSQTARDSEFHNNETQKQTDRNTKAVSHSSVLSLIDQSDSEGSGAYTFIFHTYLTLLIVTHLCQLIYLLS